MIRETIVHFLHQFFIVFTHEIGSF